MKVQGLQKQMQDAGDHASLNKHEIQALEQIYKLNLLDEGRLTKIQEAARNGDKVIKEEVRILQRALKADGKYSLTIDGLPEGGTMDGVKALIGENAVAINEYQEAIKLIKSASKENEIPIKQIAIPSTVSGTAARLTKAFDNAIDNGVWELSIDEIDEIISAGNNFLSNPPAGSAPALAQSVNDAVNDLKLMQTTLRMHGNGDFNEVDISTITAATVAANLKSLNSEIRKL